MVDQSWKIKDASRRPHYELTFGAYCVAGISFQLEPFQTSDAKKFQNPKIQKVDLSQDSGTSNLSGD